MRHCTCHKKLFLLTASRPNISVLFSRLSHKDGSVTREQFSAYIWSHYSYRHCTVTQHKDNSTSPFHPSWRKQLSLPHVQWHPRSYFRLLEVQGNRDWTGRTARLLEASGSKMELRNILKTLLRKVTEDQLQWPARTKADDAGGRAAMQELVFACLVYKEGIPSCCPHPFRNTAPGSISPGQASRFILTFFKNTDFYLFIVNRLKIQHRAVSLRKSVSTVLFTFKRTS